MDKAAKICEVRTEAADSNGILPMAWAGKEHMTAYSFRKHVQKSMADALLNLPLKNSTEGISRIATG